MKKQILTLLTLAVMCCMSQRTWAEDVVHDLLVNGAINSEYFTATGASVVSETYVVGGVTYTQCVQMAGTTATPSGVNDPPKVIQYDARTTETEVEFVVVNKSTGTGTTSGNARKFYYTVIENDETTCSPEVFALGKNKESLTTISETRTSSSIKNRSIYFSVDNKDDVRILAIKITEKGTPLPMAGEAGYAINFANARLIAKSNQNAFLDGMKLYLNEDYTALTCTRAYVTLRSDGQMIKFHVPNKVKLTLTVHSAGATDCKFYVNNTYGVRTSAANENIAVPEKTYEYILDGNQDWFIYTAINKTVKFSSLSFSSLDVTVDPPANYVISDAGVITFDQLQDYSYKFQMLDGEDVVIEQNNVTSGTTITRPFLKGGEFTTKLYAIQQGTPSDPAEATWTLSDLSTPEENLPNSEYCGYTLSNGNAESEIGMTWETDEDGNVNIYAVGVGAQWRSTGFKGMSSFKVGDLPASLYFDEQYTKGSNVYTLKLKEGKTIALGEKIKFKESAQWQINGAGNYYKAYELTYTYGANCPVSGLTAPTNLAIDDANTLTFTGDENATDYTAIIYYDNQMIDNLTVEPTGTVLPRPMLTGASYQIGIIANGEGGEQSDESEKKDWVLTDAPAEVTGSEYCSYAFGTGTQAAMMSWEMDADGNVVISIAGENNTTWRGTGFYGMHKFMVGKVPASYFFEQDYVQGTTIYTLKKKSGVTIATGEQITYKGTLQWKNDIETNAYLENQTLTYSYGGICVGLDKPVITEINANKQITFTGDEAAESFVLNVTFDGVGVHTQPIANGDAINFIPRLSGDYKVTLIARAEGLSDSEPSDEYTWSLTAEPYTPAASEVCVQALDEVAYLSITTDEDNVVISIFGDNATAYRNGVNTFDFGGFLVGTASASNYFTPTLIDNKTYQLTLKSGVQLGQGMLLSYHGNIRWMTSVNDNAYIQGADLAFTYGNTCVDNAPVLIVSGNSQTCTSIQLTMQAEDDHGANITYTISRAGATDIIVKGASNETKNVVVEGLESNVEYTFSIVASDGINTCAPQEVKVTPLCDEEAPTNLVIQAAASSETSIKVTMSATDNFEGNLIYTLYRDDEIEVENLVKLSGETFIVNVENLGEAQTYEFYFTVRDIAGNSATSDKVSATTFSSADNIAYHKLATAGSEEGAHGAAYAVDGDNNTYWGNYGKPTFDEHNNWLAVDLCGIYTINRVTITWQHFPDYAGFVLQVRNGEDEWQTVFTHEGDNYQGGQTQIIDLATPTPATDIRVFSEGATNTWYMAIYELKAFGEGAVILDDHADNAAKIAAMEGLTTDVALNRNFVPDTKYTLCVPFAMNEEQIADAFGSNALVYDLTDAYIKGNSTLYLGFSNVSTIEAGTPYIIVPSSVYEANTVIEGVTLSSATQTRGNSLATFYGVTSATELAAGKFVLNSADSYLYETAAGTLYGMRGYFELNLTPEQKIAVRSFRAVFNHSDVVTNLGEVDDTQCTMHNGKYIIDGRFVIMRNNARYNGMGQQVK